MSAVNRRRTPRPRSRPNGRHRAAGPDYRTWAGAVAATAVAVVALVQPAAYLAQTIPMTTAPVDLPAWFTTVAPQLPDHQVLLVLPAPFTSFDNSMTWQARGPHALLDGGRRRPRRDSGAGGKGDWTAPPSSPRCPHPTGAADALTPGDVDRGPPGPRTTGV